MKKTGALLRKVREEKGLSLHEIGLSLKINPKILKQIEDGEQNNLPAKTFLRGFVQSYSIFLKLDPDEVLRIFSEEMGSTKPKKIPTSPGSDSKNNYLTTSAPYSAAAENRNPGNARPTALEKKEFELKKFGIGILVIFLLLSLIGIRKIVEKYQKELEVENPKIESEDVATSSPETDENSNPIPISISNVTLPKENAKPIQPTTTTLPPAAAVSPPTSPTPPVPTPVPAAKVTSPAASTATHTLPGPGPTPAPAPTAKPIPSGPSSSSSAAGPVASVTASAVLQAPSKPIPPPASPSSPPPASPPPQPAMAPNEIKKSTNVDVLIEALDNVDVEVVLSSGKAEVFKLLPFQTQRIKTSTGVKINFSNGGAINLIVNGKDLGIPGDLGKPKRVSF